MDLSIIIVSYNVKEKLNNNLQALFKSRGNFSFEVFVVDNNSQDGSAEMVEKNFPQVKLIKNEDNLGFSRANNIAIKQSRGDFILLLNPDMQVFAETLEKSLNFAKNNSQAIVSSCKLVDEKNNIIRHVRRFPKFFDQLMIILKIPHVFPKILDKYLVSNFNYDQSQKVDSVRGSFFVINKNKFKELNGQDLPLLDERYFVWFEEVDFCKQIYQLGGEVWYNSQAECLDYVGQSFSLLKRKKAQKLFRDSMLKYFKKWQPRWQYFLLKIFWLIGMFFTLLFSRDRK
ncbi:MAG TPA: glycosyltransferase family 2 protein [bacterium]|nr:glycosyltransferase family 2 protein [bacterium]HPV65556.1 glycosyltransferase family 2 protein [bacterium]